MDLNEARALALAEMDKHGLLADGWRLKWDVARSRHGQTRYAKKEIGISRPIAAVADRADVHDTILHEVAHALVGPWQAHNATWRAKAIEIGGSGTRYAPVSYTAKVADWLLWCPAGQHVAGYKLSRPSATFVCRTHRWVTLEALPNSAKQPAPAAAARSTAPAPAGESAAAAAERRRLARNESSRRSKARARAARGAS